MLDLVGQGLWEIDRSTTASFGLLIISFKNSDPCTLGRGGYFVESHVPETHCHLPAYALESAPLPGSIRGSTGKQLTRLVPSQCKSKTLHLELTISRGLSTGSQFPDGPCALPLPPRVRESISADTREFGGRMTAG